MEPNAIFEERCDQSPPVPTAPMRTSTSLCQIHREPRNEHVRGGRLTRKNISLLEEIAYALRQRYRAGTSHPPIGPC
jgi:hypothetical protein